MSGIQQVQYVRFQGTTTKQSLLKSRCRRAPLIKATTQTQEINERGGVVVVGAGPAGLAASLMLAQKGWKNITILEASPRDKLIDPNRSYSYMIHGRGFRSLKMLNIQDEVKQLGFPASKQKKIIYINADGSIEQFPFNMMSPSSFEPHMVLRVDMINILMQKINDDFSNSINYLFNTKCIELKKENEKIQLTYQINNQELKTIEPKLIIGCDGYNSVIRKQLQKLSGNKKFALKTVPLPKGGGRYKVFQFPLDSYLDKYQKHQIQNDCLYQIFGKSLDADKKLNILSFFPPKTLIEKNLRLGIVATYVEDHILWKLDTGDKLLNHFEQEFPQLQIREVISPEQAENFAKSKGGTYSQGGYCENSAFFSPQENNNFQGVVLIGDSLHHFPPTFGQGVNSAFEDVQVLSEILERNNNELKNSLEQYEKNRTVDAKALVEMQKTLPARFKFVTTFLVVFGQFQRFLHGKLPQVFPPPTASYILNDNLRYSEAKKLQEKASKIYYGVLYGLVFATVVGINSISGLAFK